ncbi:MetQ/NlpA family ABC transporter substrate-binding protein [Salinibacterium sp. ZJ77]|uniref:MetQ/NlpA family ABC transporter substrate-binding protein n=1 Tax=Salinibacterium sp. ZJ77 TaxID=2708337 RepID=UPI00141E8ECA|nr:MetQ/NlpA family ABC transporter substrate-binding protein [Salinibacterium sp. ZJ77]
MSDQKSTPDGQSELRSAVAANSRKKRTIIVGVASVLAAALVAGAIAIGVSLSQTPSAQAGSGGAADERISVKIATAEDTQFQDAIKEVAAENGLDVEWVNVDDWVLPNTELAAGTVDANAFQHILYLSAFNVESGAELTPVFSTVITQWGIFSATLDDLTEIPDGGRIAIPDDPSNGGRALFILEAAGFLELADDAGDFPTAEDVTSNPKNLEFVAIGARTIPQQFDDPSLAAVVVGTAYFEPAQGIGKDDALYLDDSLAEQNLPYVNVVAVRSDDADNPAWKILEKSYADPRVAAALDDEFFGNTVLVNVPVETLRDKLAALEKLAAENR